MKGCPDGFDCGKVHALLTDYLDEDLANNLYMEVCEHLKKCPDCTLHVDSVKKVIRLYRNTGDAEAHVDIKIRLQDVLDRAAARDDEERT